LDPSSQFGSFRALWHGTEYPLAPHFIKFRPKRIECMVFPTNVRIFRNCFKYSFFFYLISSFERRLDHEKFGLKPKHSILSYEIPNLFIYIL
jgi:hypothetical protein